MKPLPHRVFATSRFDIDNILARPYDREVPFGASGDRVWATSPQGWGFGGGVNLNYLTNLHLFDLFDSFTRAQYGNGDFRYPWTGEFYNGDTGEWKTSQRDYNHSTWVDPLIHDLLGPVARNYEVLEIDPHVSENNWSWWCQDGKAYRGHDVTIAWDSKGGRVAPGYKGFAVYLDGVRIFAATRPKHILYDMQKKRIISASARTDAETRKTNGSGLTRTRRLSYNHTTPGDRRTGATTLNTR